MRSEQHIQTLRLEARPPDRREPQHPHRAATQARSRTASWAARPRSPEVLAEEFLAHEISADVFDFLLK